MLSAAAAAAVTTSVATFRFPTRRNLVSLGSFSAAIYCLRGYRTIMDSLSSSLPDEGKQQQPWLIVGLGNPGRKYEGTHHNVGFELVDIIAKAEQISMSSVYFKSLFGKGFMGNVPVILAKPQTFMNASGVSVSDDLDLPFAKLRLLPKGGHGGHNRMKSIINHLTGSRDFPRLRIGIGRPPEKMDPVNFVLRPFNKQEQAELDFTFGRGLEAVRILVEEGFDKSATLIDTVKSLQQLHQLLCSHGIAYKLESID